MAFAASTLFRLQNQRPARQTTPTPTTKLVKGEKNGLCNRSACQKPGATFRNIANGFYYCPECAGLINWPGGQADCQRSFGRPLYCMVDAE